MVGVSMDFIQASILGAVQGLTEFLPISSSGHLILVPQLLGWGVSPLAFDTTLHLGTAAALVVYFFKDLIRIFTSFIRDVWTNEDEFSKFSLDGKMGIFILLGSIPAGIIGFVFQRDIETIFRSVEWVILFLISGSVLMLAAEKIGRWKLNKKVGYLESFAIGLFQSLALLPGISRSGSTISGGMLFGLDRENAARFSFLLSVPIVVLAGGYELYKSLGLIQQISPEVMLTGFLSSFIVGVLTIKFLLNFLKKNGLFPFIIYRIILVIFLLVTVL